MTETARIIEAEKFVLRDSKGRRRAELGTQDDDNPELVLFNDQEHPQARFSTKFGSASVELLDSKGLVRATLGAGLELGGSASPSLTLHNSEGRPAIALTVIDAIKAAGLNIYGGYEQPRLTVSGTLLEEQSGFVIGLSDENGTTRIRLRVADAHGGSPSLDLIDGQNRMSLSVAEGGLYLMDETGSYRVKIAQTEMGPAVAVVDRSGVARGILSVSDETGIAHLLLIDPQGTVRFDAWVNRDGVCQVTRKRWWWPF